ncbi:ATP-binding protein [uncultured Jannaschia sp.]|uniref:ATP-binding protein n=1 Tax=uncultured Jannaschia sp. TaxID=293347 RepID=UPI0026302925|nr:ATP-binding protein [uncultured Jannaschia sp.]
MRDAIKFAAPDRSGPEHASTLRTLNAFAVDIISIPNVEDLFWYVAQNVVGRLNFVDCVIYRADAEETTLTQAAALGEKNPYGRTIINPLRIPFGQGITGQVAETRAPIVVDDLLKDQNYIPDTRPARSEICVPLVSQGKLVGVIDSEHPQIAAFGAAELEVLTTVAAMTSAKLELLAEVERSNQRYRDLVQSHAQLTTETSNRKALETELFNVRKLEAIGRLTGGFAHGFNNLLTVIAGNLELIGADPAAPHSWDCLVDAKNAADRGARLIRDMLAFAQKLHLDPKIVDVNALVRAACEENSRSLSRDVALELAADPWPIEVDPGAAEMALVNLMMNARDAMPDGGRLTISTENVVRDLLDDEVCPIDCPPGRYVRLSVSDQGAGIAEDARQRIFDPFFTTKQVGDGTGLGLSMVQGFVRQSGGAVRVRPNTPEGTVFDLFFPIVSRRSDGSVRANG